MCVKNEADIDSVIATRNCIIDGLRYLRRLISKRLAERSARNHVQAVGEGVQRGQCRPALHGVLDFAKLLFVQMKIHSSAHATSLARSLISFDYWLRRLILHKAPAGVPQPRSSYTNLARVVTPVAAHARIRDFEAG